MENLSHSRHPNRAKKICGNAGSGAAARSLYDDVYGGPPPAKTKNHLSPRAEDYGEIFGSFRGSSIPVLDLPAVEESEAFFDVRSSGFDYDEVFGGGFEGLDFAVSFEDLINGSSCDQAWSHAELESMSEESDISGKNQYFSNGDPQHQLEGDTEFNISYHRSPQMSGGDISKGMTHVAQLHAIPGYSFMVNSPSQLTEAKVTGTSFLDMDFIAESIKPKQHKKTKSLSYNGSPDGHAFENDLRQQKGHGKDGSLHGNAFLDISKISLRTQPSDLPPPSRPPPAAGGKMGDSGQLAPKRTHSFEGILGDSSPTFFDVEVDATSSAAVSAAAIKEAMEKAQAKLKSAKELMEKRKEGLQSSHKLGSKKHTKENLGGMGKVVDGSDRTKDEKLKGTLERDGSGTKLVAREEKEKASKPPFEVPGIFHGDELLGSNERYGKDKHKKEPCSSGWSNKVDEASLWREATEFFELVTSDEPKKAFEQANCEKILVQSTQINEHEHKENGAVETSEKQSGHGRKVKTTRKDHEVEEFGEKKLEQSRLEELTVKSKEVSEMKDCGNKIQPTLEVFDEGENKNSATLPRQFSEPNKQITKPEKAFDQEEFKKTQLTPIDFHGDESGAEFQASQNTLAREKVETTSNETLSVDFGRKHEVVDKKFKASSITDNAVMDDAQDPRPLGCLVETTSGEFKTECEVSEELGVFEIENLLDGENLNPFGKFQGNLDTIELAHIDNQVKNTVEAGSVEQFKSFSPMGFDSDRQKREFTHEYENIRGDSTEVQVSLNWEENESATPTQVVIERSEYIRDREAAQPTMAEEKSSQESVQQVDVTLVSEIKEKVHEDVDAELEKRERELNNQKVEEEKEREREREREVKQKNQKSAQQVKASQTAERKENTSEEVETERMRREQELDKERLRNIEEERKREAKKKNQKPAQLVNASKSGERKEKAQGGEFESERKKMEREMESDRLRREEEEKEREREREKDRMAVDLATLEARERVFGESREKAERVSIERATAEARQRAMSEARERLEKACAEAREKSLAGKTAMESRIRAERAAVERATAEARERAAGAMAERAAFEARDRVQRSVSDKFSASSRNNGLKHSASSSDLLDLQFQSSGVSRYQYSAVYGARCDDVVEGESAQRCKARLERHRRTSERAAKALAEKNMRDLLAQREQAERNRLAESLGAEVKRWSSGKEGNLRALLSTLQYILGPDSGWQPIPLTEVITSVAVKKAYRKATLCVHPDKLQQRGASIHHKYVCEKVFDLLKEAWNKFNSEER